MQKINFNVDIRNVIIIFLILLALWLFFNPFGTNKIKQLENDNQIKEKKIEEIQKERKKLEEDRKKIDAELIILMNLARTRKDTIEMYRKISKLKDHEISDLKDGIDLYNELIRRQRAKIEELTRNPIILPKNKLVEKLDENYK